MENSKVIIKSMVGHRVSVNSPDLRFNRTWPGLGAIVKVDREVLDELMYDQGFMNMLQMGILYIEDMKVKQELGLEPEDATVPQNIIVLNNADKEQYMTKLTLAAFKEKVAKLSKAQLEELSDYAIEHRHLNVDKCNVLKTLCGRDVINAVRIAELDKEN